MPILTEQGSVSPPPYRRPRFQPRVAQQVVDSVLARSPMREDQKDAVRAYFSRFGGRRPVPVVEMPTGTGKTWVGVAAAVCLLQAGYTVLWVCKRWKLLRQAADAFAALAPAYACRIRWLGSRRGLSPVPHADGSRGQVVLTTLQTWYARRGRLHGTLAPSGRLAVVWDEAHWGFESAIGRAFRTTYAGRVPMLGLSATPPASDRAEVIYRKSPEDYFGTILATPGFEQVVTDVEWTPEVRSDDFTPASLRVLADSTRRNDLIVNTVVELRAAGRAKCMIVFATSITHAVEIARLLSERGVPARAVHSRQPPKMQDEAEELFRAGRIDVLVNVDQLTEGFDHPPVDAVLIACPTRSRRRWVQMVGRGARKAPGKDTFLVVDFVDNLTRFGADVVRAGAVYPSLAGVVKPRAYTPPASHAEPPDVPKFVNHVIPGFGTVPIALGQTFGVEVELTARDDVPDLDPEWRRVARSLIDHLGRHVTAPVHPEPLTGKGGPLTAWRVMYDGSAGWEVVSPVLVDAGGVDELQRACRAITELVEGSGGEVRVNHRTGLHLTLATRLDTDDRLRGFVKLVQRLEPGLFTLVAPSRLYPFDAHGGGYARRAGNEFCLPLRGLGQPDRLDLDEFEWVYGNRYRTVNLTNARNDVPLIEVRMHHGTHEFNKVVLWLSLWMQLFNAARHRWAGPARPGLVFPGRNRRIALADTSAEDIVALLKAEGVPLTPEFVRLLRGRRKELRRAWAKVMPNRVERWTAAGWYD